jgi:hypothetical protein
MTEAMTDPRWPRGYGADVRRLAREVAAVGVGAIDLPRDWSERKRATSMTHWRRQSLSKIFGHPVDAVTQRDELDGSEFVIYFRREAQA